MARPKKHPRDKYETPGRHLGRVDDDTWHLLVEAAKSQGKTFTQWAVDTLVRAAKRQGAKR